MCKKNKQTNKTKQNIKKKKPLEIGETYVETNEPFNAVVPDPEERPLPPEKQ